MHTIFDPIKDEMFYAEKNNGAFFNNQRIRVSKKNNLDECLFAVGKLKNEPSFTYRRSDVQNLILHTRGI